LLPTNGGQVAVMMGAVLLSPFVPVFSERLPLEPVQILWVNLIIALACAIPLAREIKEKGILDKPPRDISEPLANAFFLQRVGIVSVVEALSVFSVFIFAYLTLRGSGAPYYLAQAGTAAFTTLIFVEVFYLFTARSIRGSAFTLNPFANKWVLMGAFITLGLQVLIVYSLPLFGVSPFRTVPFPARFWLIILLVAPAGFFAVELEKFIRWRLKKAGERINLVRRIIAKEPRASELGGELIDVISEEGIAEDRFDRLIKKCEILDIKHSLPYNELFKMIAAVLSKRAGVGKEDLYNLFMDREKLGSTAISPGLAIPHIIAEAVKEFDIVLIRCKEGIMFPDASQPVRILFVLTGPSDERNFYLRALAAIAQIAQDKNFDKNWLKTENTEELRDIILSAERKRIGSV
jgi:mannitol/fructose-specific phosphotransferase system IIA component (Ntr-type)